jgi:hypothetical protein
MIPFLLPIYLWQHGLWLHGLWLHGGSSSLVTLLVGIAVLAAWLPRVLAAVRFRQDWRSALLHPIGITVLLALQWYALALRCSGRSVRWKERSYATP